jgi:hypothetical protein
LVVLSDLWESSLYPQLEELFQGRVEQLAVVLDLDRALANGPLRLVQIEDAFAEVGGLPYIERQATNAASLVAFLRHLGRVMPPQHPTGE